MKSSTIPGLRDPYPRDAYGFRFNEEGERARRHPKCSCKVPCQVRFTCDVCQFAKPWCCGSSDDMPGACDDCWNKAHKATRTGSTGT